jgi:putative membrane protein
MKQSRSFIQYLGVTLRGIAMGAADVIPGVSGGTIAFITGIYEELINSIGNVNLTALKKLKNEGLSSFWNYINGNFIVALLVGIVISILSLARVVTYLLEEHPVLLWAFFFGLVIASSQLVLKTVEKWNAGTIIGLLIGFVIAAYISTTHTIAGGGDLWYIFLCGAIAICAMILPGISGAFILVLMGTYSTVIAGLKNMDITLILVFIAGCVTGLLSFSRLLKYLFATHKSLVLSILSGFLIGSLFKIWPWQNRIGDAPIVVHSDGKEDWMTSIVWPSNFEGNPQLLYVILLAITGYMIIFVMSKLGPKTTVQQDGK